MFGTGEEHRRRTRVLVVHTDEATRNSARCALETSGAVVDVAPCARVAWAMLVAAAPYDAVLVELDAAHPVHIPLQTRIEALTPDTAVVIVAPAATSGAHLLTPFTPHAVVSAVTIAILERDLMRRPLVELAMGLAGIGTRSPTAAFHVDSPWAGSARPHREAA
jgi:hypothetical protein